MVNFENVREDVFIVLFLLVIFSPVIYQLVIVIREHKKERKLAIKRLRKLIKGCLLILIPVSLIIAVLSHTNYLDYEQPISFERFDEITFENFRGIELFKKTLLGSEKFAYVVTSIDFEVKGDEVEVKSLFHPSRSFVYDKYANSKELLTHEKYHFKITELFARKARKQIKNLDLVSKKKVVEIIKQIKTQERAYQQKYDYDTYHSYIFSEQKKYEQKIDSLLSLFANYKKSKIAFNEED